MWLKGRSRVGEEEDMEEGQSVDPHGGGGGPICQGEDDACGREEGVRKEKGEESREEERSNTGWEVYQVLKQGYAAPGLRAQCESVQ